MTTTAYDRAREINYQLHEINDYARRNLEGLTNSVRLSGFLTDENKKEVIALLEKGFNIEANIAELQKEFDAL